MGRNPRKNEDKKSGTSATTSEEKQEHTIIGTTPVEVESTQAVEPTIVKEETIGFLKSTPPRASSRKNIPTSPRGKGKSQEHLRREPVTPKKDNPVQKKQPASPRGKGKSRNQQPEGSDGKPVTPKKDNLESKKQPDRPVKPKTPNDKRIPRAARNLNETLTEEPTQEDGYLPGQRVSRRVQRRASRPPPMTLEQMQNMLRACEEPACQRVKMEHMGGYGVVAARQIWKGDFVCEYSGDLIGQEEAKQRENRYIAEDRAKGIEEPMCYMYFLDYKGKKFCVDATKSGRIGRLINHSRLAPNLKTKLFEVDGVPRLGLVALKDVEVGTELLYDYGERDPKTLKAHPWLRT